MDPKTQSLRDTLNDIGYSTRRERRKADALMRVVKGRQARAKTRAPSLRRLVRAVQRGSMAAGLGQRAKAKRKAS